MWKHVSWIERLICHEWTWDMSWLRAYDISKLRRRWGIRSPFIPRLANKWQGRPWSPWTRARHDDRYTPWSPIEETDDDDNDNHRRPSVLPLCRDTDRYSGNTCQLERANETPVTRRRLRLPDDEPVLATGPSTRLEPSDDSHKQRVYREQAQVYALVSQTRESRGVSYACTRMREVYACRLG